MAKFKIGDKVHVYPSLNNDTPPGTIVGFDRAGDPIVQWAPSGASVAYYAHDLELAEIDDEETFDEPTGERFGCSHTNKRQSFSGMMASGEWFWYCPDCKKEV